MDEACALIKTELDSMPTELDEMNRRIMQMEIEEAALKEEEDRLSKERLEIYSRSWLNSGRICRTESSVG